MKKAMLYIHGKGGGAEEAEHYKPLFTGYDVIGFDYKAQTPWAAKEEFALFFESCNENYESISIIANSIGAFFAMHALYDRPIEKALFISPIVNMEKLISDMMTWANITEEELNIRKEIATPFGETLSWEYLCYVRKHPITWNIPTHILFGEKDNLTSYQTVCEFADKIKATLTIMKNGEHWFHTQKQMQFLDSWIGRFV